MGVTHSTRLLPLNKRIFSGHRGKSERGCLESGEGAKPRSSAASILAFISTWVFIEHLVCASPQFK